MLSRPRIGKTEECTATQSPSERKSPNDNAFLAFPPLFVHAALLGITEFPTLSFAVIITQTLIPLLT